MKAKSQFRTDFSEAMMVGQGLYMAILIAIATFIVGWSFMGGY